MFFNHSISQLARCKASWRSGIGTARTVEMKRSASIPRDPGERNDATATGNWGVIIPGPGATRGHYRATES